MGSDSDTHLATQQSIKAYVDSQSHGGGGGGSASPNSNNSGAGGDGGNGYCVVIAWA